MTNKMPRWAQKLLERHPGAERPTPENPMPAWLEEELKRVPLWYHIREASDQPRFAAPYHLIEDARKQPELLRQVLGLAGRFESIAKRISQEGIEHLVFIGCGSAYYNSVLGAFLFPRLTGLTAEASEAWEFYNYYHPTGRKALVIAQSATGGSFEVLDAVRRARSLGMPTLALTNTFESPLEELADETVAFPTGQRTGPDISVIPTRLLMMYLLAVALGRLRKPGDPLVERIAAQLPTVPDIAERFFAEQDAAIQALARKYYRQSAILVVGGGPNWFTALEAALKIEEESSTPCRTYQTADYPHMAISLLRQDRTTLVIAPPGPSYARLHTCVRTARASGSPAVAVVLEGDDAISRDADDVIVVPGRVDEMLFPPLGTMVGQLYGYYLGVNKGWNPDCLGTDDIAHARAWLTAFPLGSH
ncbi:MAG: SIS domain-containing protein [Firmicutes bacterium]|nr:SIS domain-containing protein [Bacillota bacterium]